MSAIGVYISGAVSGTSVYRAINSDITVMTSNNGCKRRAEEDVSIAELPVAKRVREDVKGGEEKLKEQLSEMEMKKEVIGSGFKGPEELVGENLDSGDEADDEEDDDDDDDDDSDSDSDSDEDGDEGDDDDDNGDDENDKHEELIRRRLLELNENIRHQIYETKCFLRDVCSHIDFPSEDPTYELHLFVRPEQQVI